MNDLPTQAALAWAQAHAATSLDPVHFGDAVARVYLACQATKFSADPIKTAAALAALSVPDEKLQRLERLVRLISPSPTVSAQTSPSDAEGSA